MSLDPFVPTQLPFLQKGEALQDICLSRVGIAGLSLRLFLYSGWLLGRKSRDRHSHQQHPRVPKAPPRCPRLACPCPVLQSCCLLPGQAKRVEGAIVTNQLGAISAALRMAGKTSHLPKGRGQRRQRNRGGSGRAGKALRVTISIQGPSPRAAALLRAKSHSPCPGERQSHMLVPPSPVAIRGLTKPSNVTLC